MPDDFVLKIFQSLPKRVGLAFSTTVTTSGHSTFQKVEVRKSHDGYDTVYVLKCFNNNARVVSDRATTTSKKKIKASHSRPWETIVMESNVDLN